MLAKIPDEEKWQHFEKEIHGFGAFTMSNHVDVVHFYDSRRICQHIFKKMLANFQILRNMATLANFDSWFDKFRRTWTQEMLAEIG